LRRLLGEAHSETAKTEFALASLYERLGRRDEAEPLMLGACRTLSERLGTTHSRTRDCADSLARLYEGWGKPEKAREWRGQAGG
jgi:hypothetical protein